MRKARLTFFNVERFVWVLGLRVFGVLWVFVALLVFLFLALVRCFPLYTAGVPRALTLFIKVFLYLSKNIYSA